MKKAIVLTGLTTGLMALSGCTSGAVTDVAAYGAANAVAYPPKDADEVAKNAQANLKEGVGHVNNLVGAAKEGIYHGMDSFADWMRSGPPPKPPRPIAASYCYSVYQDILCYRQPMPGWSYRLVGYQGTYAAPPVPAQTLPLPVQSVDISKLPANRIAAAKPVFATIPPQSKDQPADQQLDQPVTVDTTHALPNPALAPQL